MQLYITHIEMSSPNQILESTAIDEMTQELKYKWKKKVRQDISAVRERHGSYLRTNSLDFYGLHICSAEEIEGIMREAQEADKEMKAIEKSLHAIPVLLPLKMDEIAKGELYDQVLSAIRYRIVSQVIERIDDMTKKKSISQLSDRSREALVKMVENLKVVNVLKDAQIDQKLDQIRKSIEKDSIEPLYKELIVEVEALSQRGAFMKFRSHESHEGSDEEQAKVKKVKPKPVSKPEKPKRAFKPRPESKPEPAHTEPKPEPVKPEVKPVYAEPEKPEPKPELESKPEKSKATGIWRKRRGKGLF